MSTCFENLSTYVSEKRWTYNFVTTNIRKFANFAWRGVTNRQFTGVCVLRAKYSISLISSHICDFFYTAECRYISIPSSETAWIIAIKRCQTNFSLIWIHIRHTTKSKLQKSNIFSKSTPLAHSITKKNRIILLVI